MARLVDRVERWANKPMRPGEGLHIDIFRAAIMLLEEGHAEDEVFKFLRKAADCVTDRRVPDREVLGAITSAKQRMAGGELNTPRWPDYNPALRAEIIAHAGVTTQQLAEASESQVQDPWFYVERLYQSNEYICIGATSYTFSTQTRDEWKPWLAAYSYEYINPAPMTAPFGIVQGPEGPKSSAHCLDNCGRKRFQVVEFDHGTADEHAAILWHLALKAKLVLITYSGGKSLHGWYNVASWSEIEICNFFRSAVELGADPKMWSRCQFSRLPAGRNTKTGRQQTVVVFEPKHLT